MIMGRSFVLPYLFLSVGLFSLSPLLAQDGPAQNGGSWLTDYEQARKQARAHGKDLLLDFTGSDWCVWCKRLEQEVFGRESFQKEAAKHFVLVKIDFPQDKRQPAALVEQNRGLMAQFVVEGYPTIYLVDVDGRPYASTGYKKGGPEIYLGHLRELRKIRDKRDTALGKAATAAGLERARHLSAALDSLPEGLPMRKYLPLIEEIVKLDPKDEARLKTRFTALKKRLAMAAAMRVLSQELDQLAKESKWQEVVARIDRFVKEAEPKGNALQQLLWMQACAHYQNKDKAGAVASFEEVRKVDTTGKLAKEAERALKAIRKEIAEEETKRKKGEDGEKGK